MNNIYIAYGIGENGETYWYVFDTAQEADEFRQMAHNHDHIDIWFDIFTVLPHRDTPAAALADLLELTGAQA